MRTYPYTGIISVLGPLAIVTVGVKPEMLVTLEALKKMGMFRRGLAVLPLAGLLVLACSSASEEATDEGGAAASDYPAGALIGVTMKSNVGVLLDDLKALPAAESAALEAKLTAKPVEFWKERVRMQMRLTLQRQYFRHYYYGDSAETFAAEKKTIANPEKGQLPLPPENDPNGKELWSKSIVLEGKPAIQTVDGHRMLVQKYTYTGTLVTDADSPAKSDKALATIGGVVEEPHKLPVDPDLLRQRTGLACLTEVEFPANSVDSENAWRFYDYTCTKDSADCHTADELRLGAVHDDCISALRKNVGLAETSVRFERLPYNRTTADTNRTGTITRDKAGKILPGADMTVRADSLENNRLVWKYVSGASCEIEESDMSDNHKSSCVVRPDDIKRDGGGWRHVLEFDAVGYNVGNYPVHIGNVNYLVETGVETQVEDHGVFEKSACHNHYHFKHYGDFLFSGGTSINKKNGFCLESTTRYSNNEVSPVFTQYGRCIHQGVEVGWGDEYEAGLVCQWVDVTDAKPGSSKIGFFSNPDGFLCEGKPKAAAPLDAKGLPTPDTQIKEWEATAFKTDTGKTVERPACNFGSEDWIKNNKEEVPVTIPKAGGMVSGACKLDGDPKGSHATFGPARDCDLHHEGADPTSFHECTPGQVVTLSCTASGTASQVLRVCEGSHAFGGAIDCVTPAPGTVRGPSESLAQAVLPPAASTTVSFMCPAGRDRKELGGRYALYTGSYVAGDAPQAVTCK